MTLPDPIVRLVKIDGHDWWIGPNGWKHPAVRGGEGPVDPPAPPTPPPDTLTKAQAEALAAQARQDAERALLAQFGDGMTPEKVKQILDAQKAAEDARKDEITRAREEADRAKAQAAQERAMAQQERLAARVERALLAAHVKPERMEFAADLIKVKADADLDTIKNAVEAFKEQTPEWFPAPNQPAPAGLPGNGRQAAQSQGPTGIEAGRARARREREAAAKKPAFGEGLTFIGGQAS